MNEQATDVQQAAEDMANLDVAVERAATWRYKSKREHERAGITKNHGQRRNVSRAKMATASRRRNRG